MHRDDDPLLFELSRPGLRASRIPAPEVPHPPPPPPAPRRPPAPPRRPPAPPGARAPPPGAAAPPQRPAGPTCAAWRRPASPRSPRGSWPATS